MKSSSNLQGKSDNYSLPLSASLYSVFLAILFGANAVTMKVSLAGLGPFTNAGLRFSVAALCILLWSTTVGIPLRVKKEHRGSLVLLGMVFFFQLSFFYFGMKKTTATHGTLIANLLPFVVMVLAHFFIPGDRVVLKKALGLVLGFFGILVLISDVGTAAAGNLTGDLFILAAVLIWGCNAVYTKRVIAHYHPVQITLYPMMIASVLFLLNGYFWDQPMVKTITPSVIAGLFYQTFVTASFGMVAWNTMIRKYGATSLHSFVFIMPLSGVLLGVLLLGEPLTLRLIASMILVVTGLIIVNRPGADQQHARHLRV